MEKKELTTHDQFIKLPTALYNGRNDRPQLNSLERELMALVLSWTANGKGKYNYQSTKEIARYVGSSNKTVLKSLHRLKALRLINWHAFPHGVGMKHLRWASTDGLRRWASKEKINEPTAEELRAVDDPTPIEILVRDVCKKPNSIGFDIWRACCLYCGHESEGVKPGKTKKAKETTPAEFVEIAAMEPAALPYKSAEFENAWQDWLKHRNEGQRNYKGNSEKIALEQLRQNAENEADAINAIYSAIAGGFYALRPDIARAKNGGATNPVCPINLWSWLQRQFEQRQRQPETMEEAKQWAAEFRSMNPDAPAWVEWNAHKKTWKTPGIGASARDAGVNGRYIELLEAYEALRQVIDNDGGGLAFAAYDASKHEAKETGRKNYQNARAKKNLEIQQAFEKEVNARGGNLLEYVFGSEENRRLIDEVREIMPEDYFDACDRFPSAVEGVEILALEVDPLKAQYF